jgi:hypothetical protein
MTRKWIGRDSDTTGLCHLRALSRGVTECRIMLSTRPVTIIESRFDKTIENKLTGCGRLPVCTFTDLNKTGVPMPNFLSTFSRSHIFNNGDLTPSSSPSVTSIPFLSTICVTLPPPECAIQLLTGTNSRLSRWMEPCMSARRRPEEEGARVDISGVF